MRRRPLPRILGNAVTAVSVILLIGTVGLWGRSYVVGDMFHGGINDRRWIVSVNNGRLSIIRWDGLLSRSYNRDARWTHSTGQPRDADYVPARIYVDHWDGLFPGLRYAWDKNAGNWASAMVVVHLGLIEAALAVIPLVWGIWRCRHAVRARGGLCPACGYDLRATPDRCPECGAVPTPSA